MAHARKTRTQYADELEHWVSQGWLTGQETCIALQDRATLTDIMYQEAAGSREVQAEICGITGRLQEVLTPLRPRGAHGTLLKARMPVLDAHPGMWPGMALYGLRRQPASSRGGLLAPSQRACEPRATSPQPFGENFAARSSNSCPATPLSTLPRAAAGAGACDTIRDHRTTPGTSAIAEGHARLSPGTVRPSRVTFGRVRFPPDEEVERGSAQES